MLRTTKRTTQRFDPISRLAGEDMVAGKIPPSRVRTLFSIPIVLLPDLDAPAFPQQTSTGLGTYFFPKRMYLWKPPGAYVGTPGNVRLRTSAGATIAGANFAYTARLTGTDANLIVFEPTPVGFTNADGLDKVDLSFAIGDVTGDGPPLHYAIFFIRVNLTSPLQAS